MNTNGSRAASRAIGIPTVDRRTDVASRDRIVKRIRAEFLDMPGLRMTIPQAARLFAVRGDICRRVLDRLVSEGMLRHGEDERYGILPPWRPSREMP